MRLKDKSAIITGAASGIGKDIALVLRARRREGRDRRPQQGRRRRDRRTRFAAAGGTAIGVAMDVTDEEAVNDGVAATVGGVRRRRHPGEQCRHPDRASARGVHATPSGRRCMAIHRRRRVPHDAGLPAASCTSPGRGGSVIYMGSVHSKEASVLKAPYVTAKHGLIGLAKVVAKEGAQARRARQRHLPGLRAHAARRQADPGAGEGARHHRRPR